MSPSLQILKQAGSKIVGSRLNFVCPSPWIQSIPMVHRRYLCSIDGGSVHDIKMPSVMDAKSGIIDKWYKKEGDELKSGESLCEATVGDITLVIDSPEDGFLAQIIIHSNKTVDVGTPLAKYVYSKEEFFNYRESLRIATDDKELLDRAEEVIQSSHKKPDAKTLLKEVRHLIANGFVREGSEFAKSLQSLARKGDPDLMALFEASYEGEAFNLDTFDKKFFLENSIEMMKERNLPV